MAGFGDEEFYPDLPAKAAALFHGLIANHPFVDGNKRTAAAVALTLLEANGHTIDLTDADLHSIAQETARGDHEAEELAEWFRQHSEPVEEE